MLTEALTLLLQLPPLAFGPPQPPSAFAPPWALVCPVGELGRAQELTPKFKSPINSASIDTKTLVLAPERFLVNRPVDMMMFLAIAYAGRATWDTSSWSTRTWQATGAVTPVLVPPLAPPVDTRVPR